jgi:cell division protein FtsQ
MRRVAATPARAPVPSRSGRGRTPRRTARPTLLQRHWRKAALAGGVLAVVAGGYLFWPGAWIDAQIAALDARIVASTAAAGLVVERVMVEGRNETSRETLLEAVGVKEGDPLLAVDPEAIRTRVEALPWIKSAAVARSFGGTVTLALTEFEPFALWQRSGKIMLVDRSGETIDSGDMARFGKLLLLVGEKAPDHAGELVEMLASEPALRNRIRAAVWVGDRRWNLHFDNGVEVKLPEFNSAAAWHELARLDRAQGLLERDLVSIDMRLPDRLVVKLAPDAAAQRNDPGSDT